MMARRVLAVCCLAALAAASSDISVKDGVVRVFGDAGVELTTRQGGTVSWQSIKAKPNKQTKM